MNYLIIGDPSGSHCFQLIRDGVDKNNITVWEDSVKGQYCCRLRGVNVTDNIDSLIEQGMRFDVTIGNPPYGSGGNDAIKFLNKALEMSDDVRLVLPLSIRKPSSVNKIRLDAVCVEDIDLPDDTFPRGIKACVQRWVRTDSLREKIKIITTHVDFTFTTADKADLMVGRSGAGPCGKVKTENFTHYADDHFFLKCNSPEIIERIVSLEPVFLQISRVANGRPHLSKHELVTTYIEYFGRGKIPTFTTHPDFEFVDRDSADICVGRVGAGSGKIIDDWSEKSSNTHYFLKASSKTIQRLKNIQEQLRELSRHQSNGLTSLSKHELVTCYMKTYGRGKIQTHRTHPDFEFVKKENGDCVILRCGDAGVIKFPGEKSEGRKLQYEDHKPDHYYIKASPKIIERLQAISPELIELSKTQNGMPGISKHDLITTYISHYG